MWRDLIHSARLIRRYPFSSVAIVVVLALGIGANTAMFASFRAWVTRPLDFADPERLVSPDSTRPLQGERERMISARDAVDWRSETRGLEGLALYNRHTFRLDDEADAERIQGARIEATLFPLLGKAPVLGRTFSADDDLPGEPAPVALISDALWRRRFGGDPGAIGSDIRLDGRPHRVVGVMEPGFAFPEWGEVWVPFGLDPDAAPRDQRGHDAIARLAPGVSREQAGAELEAVAARLAELHPKTNRGWSAELRPLRDKWLPPAVRVALFASLGAAFFVLLIICANVAGLLLAQSNARSREMALRAALGGGRARLVRQTITECTVLALAGGALGIPAAILLNRWMASWVPVRPPYLFNTEVDVQSMVFTALVTLAAGIACGLAPVARNASLAVWETLAGGRRIGGGRGRQRITGILVVGELALSTALGIGTVLLAKSFLDQRLADHGYRVRDVVSLRLDLNVPGYRGASERASLLERTLAAIDSMPQVEAVGATNRLPVGQGYAEARLEVEGVAIEAGAEPVVAAQWVTPGYFEVLGIAQLDGRGFTASEIRDGAGGASAGVSGAGEGVAIVSASLAHKLWPETSPLGRRIRPVGGDGAAPPWLRVIGTVADIAPIETMVATATPARLHLYLPWTTASAAGLTLVVHSTAPAERVVDDVRSAVQQVDPAVLVEEILTMSDAVDRDQWVSRVFSQLLGLYASIAIAIALVGVYGLAADGVSGRTHELAVRMALGARRSGVLTLVMRQGIVLGAAGIALGLLLAFAVTRFGSAMIPGMSARDPVVFAGVALLLAAVTMLAILLPARVITRIEPAVALRSE